MPLRYAQETKFVAVVDVIRRVIAACEEAMGRISVDKWPVFGGWEYLLTPMENSIPSVDAAGPMCYAPEVGVDDDSEGGDSSDEESEPAEKLVSSPRKPARARTRAPKALPFGWTKVVKTLGSGREIPHFHGPNDEYARSLVGAWRISLEAASFPQPAACEAFVLGQTVRIYSSSDELFYEATILEISSECPTVARVSYSDECEMWLFVTSRTH